MQTTLPFGQTIDNWIEYSPVHDNLVRVRSSLAERLISEGKNLIMLNKDNLAECTCLDGHELAMGIKQTTAMSYRNEVEGSYVLNQYTFKRENSINYLTKLELNLLTRFHPSWFNPLRDYFATPDFINMLKQVKHERTMKTIYPDADKQFRVFGDVNLNQVKAVIVGLDPYSTGIANGTPFAVDNGVKKPASLTMFEKAIGKTIEDTTLTTVQRQGLLLLNSAWTVEEKLSGSHKFIWESFTTQILKVIDNLEKLKVIILMGKEAQEFRHILSPKNIIVECEHPIHAAKEKRAWNDNKAFDTLKGYYRDEHNVELQW